MVAVLDLCNLFAFIFGLVVGDENSKEPIPVMVSFGASTLAWFVFVYHVARACKEKVRAPTPESVPRKGITSSCLTWLVVPTPRAAERNRACSA